MKKSSKNVLKSEAKTWPFRARAVKIGNKLFIYGRIAEIPAFCRKLGSKNTMVTSDFRPEVEKNGRCAHAH